MTIFSEVSDTTKMIAGLAVLAVATVAFAYFLHIYDKAGKYDAAVQANADLVAQHAADDKIIKDLNNIQSGERDATAKHQGEVDADIKTNPAAYGCAVPAASVRIINAAARPGA